MASLKEDEDKINESTGYYTVVASCSSVPAVQMIQDILGVDTLPPARHVVDNIHAYAWTIDNKYYTASTELCSVQERTIGNERFASGVQAIILHFDTSSNIVERSFDEVKMWSDYWCHWYPDVRLLVCDECVDDERRQVVWDWCIENQFELIEYQDPEYDVETDDEEQNAAAIVDNRKLEAVKRIRSALHAHTWPNMVMKGEASRVKLPPFSSASDEIISEEISAMSLVENGPTDSQNIASCKEDINQSIDNLLGDKEMELFEEIGAEDPGGSFEALFSRMKDMKEKASKISNDDERKAYAEQVAIMFWKAMGGDDDEIDGLDAE